MPTVGASQVTLEEAVRLSVPVPMLNASRVCVGPLDPWATGTMSVVCGKAEPRSRVQRRGEQKDKRHKSHIESVLENQGKLLAWVMVKPDRYDAGSAAIQCKLRTIVANRCCARETGSNAGYIAPQAARQSETFGTRLLFRFRDYEAGLQKLPIGKLIDAHLGGNLHAHIASIRSGPGAERPRRK